MNNPISVEYTDYEFRNLIEEYISYVILRAIVDDKTANTGLYERNQIDPKDRERISVIIRKIINEGRLTCETTTFAEDTKFVKIKE